MKSTWSFFKRPGMFAIAAGIALAFAACDNGNSPAAHTHEWSDWETTKAATCTEKGEETRTCALDATHKETQETGIDPAVHKWEPAPTATAPTCTEEGNGDQICAYNPDHTTNGKIPIDPNAHDYVWGDILTAPTCTTEGTEQGICSHDATHIAARPIDIDPDEHQWGGWVTVNPVQVVMEANEIFIVEVSVCGYNAEHEQFRAELTLADYLNGKTGDIPLTVQINLGDMTSAQSGWQKLLTAIDSTGADAKVSLDLSASTMQGTEFNPDYSVSTGKDRIAAITLPDAAESIADSADTNSAAFSNFTALAAASAGNVASIGDYAFSYCTVLTSVNFPKVTSIGNYTFAYCGALTIVSFPEVTSIGNYTFAYCGALTIVSFPEVTSIGEWAFAYCALTSVSFLDGVISIGAYAFAYISITSVDIPDSVVSIGSYAFNNLTSLRTVSIVNGVAAIPSGVFNACYQIESVTIGDNVVSIGGSAFNNVYNRLTSITIPANVTSIGELAFDKCTSLVEVTFDGDAVSTFGADAFFGDLEEKYADNGAGTYTTPAPVSASSVWEKRP